MTFRRLLLFAMLPLLALAGMLVAGKAWARIPTPPVAPAGQEGCIEDSFEDNDEQSAASVVELPFDVQGLRSCYDDNDYFAFAVGAGQVIHIDVLFTHAQGNLDVFLHTPLGSLVAGSTGTDDNEKVNYAATMDGFYAFHVGLNEDPSHQGTVYQLLITLDDTPVPTATPTATRVATPTRTPTPSKPLGDVNDDGSANSIDAALVLQNSAGLLPVLPNPTSADVNDDDRVNALDAALILQHAAGLIILN